jgi:5-formyltetrahydrofolate cyclo-ligase
MYPSSSSCAVSDGVDHHGQWLGKGGGYVDREIAALRSGGRLPRTTPVATTVYPVQLLDETVPRTTHGQPVDVIVTAHECPRPRNRPPSLNLHSHDAPQSRAGTSCRSFRHTSDTGT